MSTHREAPPGTDAAAKSGGAMSAVEWGLLFALSLVWGGSFFLQKILLGVFEPLTIVLGRSGFAAIAIVASLYAVGGRLPASGAAWRTFAGMSLLNNILPFTLILWGQKHIAVGLAAILNATTPFFAAIVAHMMAGERLTAHRLAGVVIGMTGVAVMIGPEVVAVGLGGNVLAQLAVLAAALSYGLAAVYGRRIAKLGIAPQTAAAGQLTVTTTIMLPVVLIVDQPWTLPVPGVEIWVTLLALALVSTALAYVIFYRLLSGAGAVNASLVTLLVPVWALLLGALFLGEVFTLREAAGMAVILLGLVVTDGRIVAWARRG